MSKTIEIWQRRDLQDNPRYEVVSPDHDESFEVNGFELESGGDSLVMEDGCMTLNIDNSKYFHIEEVFDGKQVEISISDEPQTATTVEVPYSDNYNTSEKVSECGVPDTEQARDEFYYCPKVYVRFEYHNGNKKPIAVKVDGDWHELE